MLDDEEKKANKVVDRLKDKFKKHKNKLEYEEKISEAKAEFDMKEKERKGKKS